MALAETSIRQGCWDQMHMPVPIRGPLAFPLRLAGIRVSRMHPNLCTTCKTQFERGPREFQLKGIDQAVSAYAVQALG